MKKVVLISGATSGMGLETVKLLAKDGHIVYGTARKKRISKSLKRQEESRSMPTWPTTKAWKKL